MCFTWFIWFIYIWFVIENLSMGLRKPCKTCGFPSSMGVKKPRKTMPWRMFLAALCIDICWHCRANLFSAGQQLNSEQCQSLPWAIMFPDSKAIVNKVSPCLDLSCSLAATQCWTRSVPAMIYDVPWPNAIVKKISPCHDARRLIDHGRDWPCSLLRCWQGNW